MFSAYSPFGPVDRAADAAHRVSPQDLLPGAFNMLQTPVIQPQDRATLKRTFRKDLKAGVEIGLFTQRQSMLTIPGRDCKYCGQTEQLMQELAALSPKIQLNTVDFYQNADKARDLGVERIPALVLGPDGTARAKFYGIPLGYEMSTIVEDIKIISRGVSPLSMETRKQLRQLKQTVHIQVFVTPTCVYCPRMARLAHAFALESNHIHADVVEIQEFPALAQRYAVKSVPLTVMDEQLRFSGAIPEAELLEKVLQLGAPSGQMGGVTIN
jgi:glutaredoxin-like protein